MQQFSLIRNPVRWEDIEPYLTDADHDFIAHMSRGKICSFGQEIPEESKEKNTVGANVIRFFAYGGDANHRILGSSICLQGAWISGELDLSFARINLALRLLNCHFDETIVLEHGECSDICLNGSRLSKGLQGSGFKTSGSVFFGNGFSSEGEIRMVSARIAGDLMCDDGRFENLGEVAFGLDGALIDGSVFMRRMSTDGIVRLLNARIGGYWDCEGGEFAAMETEEVLKAESVRVKGDVFLRGKFSALGEVNLSGMHIGGDLECWGGKFSNPGGRALVADGITVKGDIFLNRKFSAEGEVRLRGANIGGQLDCSDSIFRNLRIYDDSWDDESSREETYALNAERIKTGGHVYLNRVAEGHRPFTAHGRVRFANADIGGNFNCKGGQFLHSGKRSALAVGGLKSRGAVFLSEGFSAKGEVALHVANIGNFVCTECQSNGKIPTVINLASTKAVAVDDDKDSWNSFEFILDGFTYDTFYGHSPTKSKFRLKWLAKRPKKRRLKSDEMVDLHFSPLPYEQAAKVLFGMGRASDAREILLEKERLQTKDKRTKWWHKLYRWPWEELAGYGYKPWRTFAWALVVVGIGWCVFSGANRFHGIVPHQPAIVAHKNNQLQVDKPLVDKGILPTEAALGEYPEYPKFNPLVFSADVFIPVFALHQEPFWYPTIGSINVGAWLLGWLGWLGEHKEDILGLVIGGSVLWIFLFVALAEELFKGARKAWDREEMIRFGYWFIPRTMVVLCLYTLGLASPKHWYWLEIGFGWILTSLFLLSVTGLLRPRQSSGGKD